jgi:hypothetical protein
VSIYLDLQTVTYTNIQETRHQLNEMMYTRWLNHELYTPAWWFLLAALIIPYFLWWELVDKSKFFEILAYGLLSGTVAVILDTIGVNLIWWGYPVKLFYFFTPLLPADIGVIPVSSMLLYQYCKSWFTFFLSIVIWAAVFSFIVEPLFKQLGLFSMDHWKHIYSFIYFILFGMCIKLAFWLICKKVKKGNGRC